MSPAPIERRHVSVRGVVQGVGFRPFVYRLAHDYDLAGWVLNHSGGVEIEVEGAPAALDAFVHALGAEAPPLARIVAVDVEDVPPEGDELFEIRHSVAEAGRYQLISPDIATCADCRRELLDPTDRRYRYPFTNCTNCGPRFTIIRDIPYDRPLTTMSAFPMCPACQAEYDDPLDRRFHAQPNACPVCGPHVWLEHAGRPEPVAERDDALRLAAALLLDGKVLAVKGLGGFHLACDATNRAAVETLRARKGRPSRPLAVMMATLDDVRRHCHVSPAEEELLTSQQAPIVLLRWRADSGIARQVAPENLYLGVMLPYTPLHHILLRDVGRPLVMTSGNLSEEPIARENDEARRRLGPLADAFFLHNRDIYARYDDSVLFVAPITLERWGVGALERSNVPTALPQFTRRSRGYAPFPIRLPFPIRPTLGVGPELKSTFCLARDDFAFLSQHIGDLENLETLEHFEHSVDLFKHLFRVDPALIAHDLHPDYLSTRYALNQPINQPPNQLVPIQHHEAHVAACLADNAWPPEAGPVLGVAWDGTGYGRDGRIWGGEFFAGNYHGLRRVAHLEYLPMPGGEAAILNPWRLALGYVYALTGETPALPGVSDEQVRIIRQQVERGVNTPLTSAAGRLFDAVAALAGIRHHVTYEAQAAIELEMVATAWAEANAGTIDDVPGYAFELEEAGDTLLIRLGALLADLRTDLASGTETGAATGAVAYRFHRTLADVIVAVCRRLAPAAATETVVLTGGCFQNRLLLSLAVSSLARAGFHVLLHHDTPCNDGCVSLGQAVLAHFAVPID
ncbi:MAG: carbamoyltransferase HypF [Anaerolineae bacterium]|nr:carbamoyltransferase HypF [Anaerolineae bacterium]